MPARCLATLGGCALFAASTAAFAIPLPEVRQAGTAPTAERNVLPGAGSAPTVVTVESACDAREPNWRSVLQALARQPGEAGTRALGDVVTRRLALATRSGGAADGEDSDPRLRDALTLLGARRGSSLAAGLVTPALHARDAGVRYAAVEALGTIGCACSRAELTRSLESDAEPLVAAAALEALSRSGGVDAALLERHATDDRAPVRSAAARRLAATLRPAELRAIAPEATEVHALRLLAAARRPDLDTLRAFVHPMRHLEVWEEGRSTTFSARTITPPMLRQEIAPPLARAAALADTLTCGARRPTGEQRCAVYDTDGYVTEMHFTSVLGRVFLVAVKHHGGYADL